MATKNLVLTFTHPRNGKTYEADVGPDLKTEELIANLMEVEFLEPLPEKMVYAVSIKRTGATLPPKTSLEAAGVQDGDTLMVTLVGGAGSGGNV